MSVSLNVQRTSPYVKRFRCRPDDGGGSTRRGPASERLQGRNPGASVTLARKPVNVSRSSRPHIVEVDRANEKMGRNSLQGDDLSNVHNQRHAVPDVKREADADMIETMKKNDDDYRARTDLGKGASRPSKDGEPEKT